MKNITILFVILISFSLHIVSQTLSDIDPETGLQCEKLTITVTGENTNFIQGTTILWLNLNGEEINAKNVNVTNSTIASGDFFFNPDHEVGYYDVHSRSGWTSAMKQDGFFLGQTTNPPGIVNSEPGSAHKGETVTLTITGINTHFDAVGVENDAWLTSNNGGFFNDPEINVIDSTHIEASFYLATHKPTGEYTLFVSNLLDGVMSLENALQVTNTPMGEIAYVDPNLAYKGDDLTLTVIGKHTFFLQGNTDFKLIKSETDYIFPYFSMVVDDTTLVGSFNFDNSCDPGVYDVQVNSYSGLVFILEDGFELLNSTFYPNLISLAPDITHQGKRVVIHITSENTNYDQEGNLPSVTLTNEYEELYGTNIVVIDSNNIKVDFVFSYSNLTGYSDLKVDSPLEGVLTIENAFRLMESVPNASIINIDPQSAYAGNLQTINVSGENIVFMQGTSNLSLSKGNLSITPVTQEIISDTIISGEFDLLSTFPSGKYDVNVDNGYAWPSLKSIEGFNLKLFDFIDENNSNSLAKVSPIPSNGFLIVNRNKSVDDILHLYVYSSKGLLVFDCLLEKGIQEKQIDLSSLPKGAYLLRLDNGAKEETIRIVIQ